MRARSVLLLAAALAGIVTAGPGLAQQAPKELSDVRTRFAAAVVKKDEAAAAALTTFPLANNVYREPKSIPRTKFKAQLRMYGNLLSCLKSTPLTRDEGSKGKQPRWMLDCDGNVLYFARKGDTWMHTEFENVNE